MPIHVIISFLIYCAIVITAVILAVYYPVALVWTTYEDLYGEWTQTYLFATALLFSVVIVARKGASYRVFFAVLAFACLYVVGEEISWGQRLLNFDSPDFFKQHNLQREANLHNFFVGPYSTVLKDVIEYSLASGLVLFGLVFPLTLRLGWRPAEWIHNRVRIPAPPLYLWPFFVTGAVLEIGLFHLNEAEFAEILVGFALAAFAAHYGYTGRRQLTTHDHTAWPEKASRNFAFMLLAIAATVCTLSYVTTSALLENPQMRARIEGRVLNGYEKFARRYERREQWETAVGLYLRVHRREPQRTFILRKIARMYQHMGEQKLFYKYTHKALAIGLTKYRKNPDKISTNLTLARTYKQLGRISKSEEHQQRAHEIALQRAADKPDSSHAAYWLGKTAKEINDLQLAYEQYRKAFELKPSSSKYRKAYYSIRRRVEPALETGD